FDLELPKKSLIRPTAVGQELVTLASRSITRGSSRASTVARAVATGTTHSKMSTRSEGTTDTDSWSESSATSDGQSLAYIDSTATVSAWGSYESITGEYLCMPIEPTGMSMGSSVSGARTEGSARARGTNLAFSTGSAVGG